MTEIIEALQKPEQYRMSRAQLYPSEQSLRWFLRQNRSELIEAGAITCPTGHWLVVPEAFDKAALEIGRRRARAGL